MSLAVGVGLSSNADPRELEELVRAVLGAHGLPASEVRAVLTLECKTASAAVVHLAATLSAEVSGYPAATLARQAAAHPSRLVGRAVGTSSVAEAALLAHGARVVVSKTARGRCTVAVGVLRRLE